MQAKPATAPFTAQKLQTIAAELMPFFELIRELDGKDFCIPTDRLIRTGDAAKTLSKSERGKTRSVNAITASIAKKYYSSKRYIESRAFGGTGDLRHNL